MTREEMLFALKAGENPLDVAIRKWEDIVVGKGKDEFRENCALCYLHEECSGCPVNELGYRGCYDTPYVDWADHMTDGCHYMEMSAKSYSTHQDCDECLSLSGKMLEFLKELKNKL